MSFPLRYVLVDVFGEKPFTGNQLAVVLDGAALSAREMQDIAREFNLSETTFVLGAHEGERGYPVRIFTPERELPFAGHPTLGTAWVIDNLLRTRPSGRVTLDLAVGSIPVARDEATGLLWMTQRRPTFHERVAATEAAALVSLAPQDLDERFPAQVVSTGLPFLLIPLCSLDAVRRARVDAGAHQRWRAHSAAAFQLVFAHEAYDPRHHLNARVFAHEVGMPEDPATGSANGCLAAYLVQHRYFGSEAVDVVVEQGFEIGRPSLLYLRASRLDSAGTGEGDPIQVQVGGRVWQIGEGQLLRPI